MRRFLFHLLYFGDTCPSYSHTVSSKQRCIRHLEAPWVSTLIESPRPGVTKTQHTLDSPLTMTSIGAAQQPVTLQTIDGIAIDASNLFTCLSCSIAFRTAEDQRAHYRSDHHRYNMKVWNVL